MKQYILQQKDVLSHILTNSDLSILKDIVHIHRITIAASGSSHNAAQVIQSSFAKAHLQINIETPFQLKHYSSLLETSDLIIAVSQTGKSKGTIDCAKIARHHHIPVIGVCGDMTSPLTQYCNVNVDLQCGEETIGPKTKGYTATCLTLYMIIFQILQNNQDYIYSLNEYKTEWLNQLDTIDQTILQTQQYIVSHQEWSQANCISVIGYGLHYGTACEGNLKLLETLQIPAMNYELEEFMHGPHRTIHKDSYLVFIHTNGVGYDLMSHLIEFARKQDAHICVIEDTDSHLADIMIPYHSLTKALFNVTVVLQVMASILPEYKGINPSEPVFQEFAVKAGTRFQ
ncbi:SIS domain-containing protein [Candidatus Stoquefichus massiliensis]|uniref:SIS domain-containing protein n=1 Tax=Candidatus Stoquefichus massiliensis TaxID=1470350 RepID=UPI0004BA875C|nr:SIS domain-containing protein [Candidatus Stoquefichus massiliensis]